MVIVQCDGSDDDCGKVTMLWVKSKIKNVGIILSVVPILLIGDLSSDSFVVIIVIATVAAIISWIIVNSYCSPFFLILFLFYACISVCTYMCMSMRSAISYMCSYRYTYNVAV